jgi:hypothetical protein
MLHPQNFFHKRSLSPFIQQADVGSPLVFLKDTSNKKTENLLPKRGSFYSERRRTLLEIHP